MLRIFVFYPDQLAVADCGDAAALNLPAGKGLCFTLGEELLGVNCKFLFQIPHREAFTGLDPKTFSGSGCRSVREPYCRRHIFNRWRGL